MSDKSVMIIATFAAVPGKGDELLDVLNRCVTPSRQEAGNLHYDLYRSPENPDMFIFHEGWQNAAVIEQHEAQPHFQALLKAVDGLLAAPPVITKI